MRAKVTVAVLLVALAAYMAIVGYQGVLLVGSGEPVGLVLGLSVLLIPLVGGVLAWREIRFGASTERLAGLLQEQGRWPTEELPTRPSGRPEREAADALYEARRAEVDQAPDDWRAWYRLGLAYDDAGDRRRAREALRHAIRLHRDQPAGTSG
jgi:cytochrome c-type biogenesis protein CcmH/NrfG